MKLVWFRICICFLKFLIIFSTVLVGLVFVFGFEIVYNKYGFNRKLSLNSAPAIRINGALELELELGQ